MKFTELTPETEYSYSVFAKNEYVESEEMCLGTITTLAVISATPSDVTAEAAIDSVTISFSPVEDATDYDMVQKLPMRRAISTVILMMPITA